MSQRFVFEVGPKGDVKMEAFGFEGKACEVASQVFTDALGGPIVDVQTKPEYQSVAQHIQARR